jgi:parallel beta-helix repeat protein
LKHSAAAGDPTSPGRDWKIRRCSPSVAAPVASPARRPCLRRRPPGACGRRPAQSRPRVRRHRDGERAPHTRPRGLPRGWPGDRGTERHARPRRAHDLEQAAERVRGRRTRRRPGRRHRAGRTHRGVQQQCPAQRGARSASRGDDTGRRPVRGRDHGRGERRHRAAQRVRQHRDRHRHESSNIRLDRNVVQEGAFGITLGNGSDFSLTRNRLVNCSSTGILVALGAMAASLDRNVVLDGRQDGIVVNDPTATLTRNQADGNAADGIRAVDGVAGSRNSATNNGHVDCAPTYVSSK